MKLRKKISPYDGILRQDIPKPKGLAFDKNILTDGRPARVPTLTETTVKFGKRMDVAGHASPLPFATDPAERWPQRIIPHAHRVHGKKMLQRFVVRTSSPPVSSRSQAVHPPFASDA